MPEATQHPSALVNGLWQEEEDEKKNPDLLKSYSRLLSGNCSTSDRKIKKGGRGMKTDQAVSAHGHAIIKQPHADVSLH